MAARTGDPLAPLLDLTGVADAFDEARVAVDAALAHRALRRQGGPAAAEAALRSAAASAALEGRGYDLAEVRTGTVTDPVVQGALRVAGALTGLTDTWRRAPWQVLARLHLLAARDAVAEPLLGRPTESPLPADQVGGRLESLAGLISGGTSAPALLIAAVVHGELLTLRPFAGPNGVVARAAARLTMMAYGLDPRGLLVPEIGHLAVQPEYLGGMGTFATGTPDGVRAWLRHCAGATVAGAAETTALCTELLDR